MNIQQILELTTNDWMTMSDAEFNKLFRQVQSASLNRVRRLKEKGLTNFSYSKYYELEGPISKKRVNRDSRAELYNELKRALDFLRHETSTVKGYKNYTDKILKNMGVDTSKWTTEDYGKWASGESLFANIKELYPEYIMTLGSGYVRDVCYAAVERYQDWYEAFEYAVRTIEADYNEINKKELERQKEYEDIMYY